MVEVDSMTDAMHDCEEECRESNMLVESNVRVKWNVVVDGRLPEVRDDVPGHCDQQDRVREHHSRGGTTCDGHTVASNATKASKLTLNRVICEERRKTGKLTW